MTGSDTPRKPGQYESNLNRTITFISQNLQETLSLDRLAETAHISKFHFVRLFKAFTGETPGEFIRRLRLEKAAFLLIFNPKRSVTDISTVCGFSSSQNMARTFRNVYGLSPGDYRKQFQGISMTEKGDSIPSMLQNPDFSYAGLLENRSPLKISTDNYYDLSKNIVIRETPDAQVLCFRSRGRYEPRLIKETYGALMARVTPLGLPQKGDIPFCVFWDNAAVTDQENCRVDACLPLPPGTVELPDGLLVQTLAGGKTAVYSCLVTDGDFYSHWNRLLTRWLPASGYQLDDRPCREYYPESPSGNDGMPLEIHIPLSII